MRQRMIRRYDSSAVGRLWRRAAHDSRRAPTPAPSHAEPRAGRLRLLQRFASGTEDVVSPKDERIRQPSGLTWPPPTDSAASGNLANLHSLFLS